MYNKMSEISYEEASNLQKKYPNRAPILVKTKGDIDLDRSKYLVPFDLKLAEFMIVLRKRIRNVEAYEGLYMFIDGKMFTPNFTLGQVWDSIKEVYYLEVTITKESTFG